MDRSARKRPVLGSHVDPSALPSHADWPDLIDYPGGKYDGKLVWGKQVTVNISES